MLKDNVQKLMDQAVAVGDNAGCNLLVLKEGEEALYCQSGYADREQEKKIERDNIFRIFSMTKPVTATAVMTLVEEGKLSLLEPVSAYLPGFKNQKVVKDGTLVPAEREMFVRDLMNMTGGLVYPDDVTVPGRATEKVYESIEKDGISTLDAANRFGQCPLMFHPGAEWRYSVSADVLGAIIEVISGMKYGDYLKEKIFDPMGMKDTAFYVPQEKQARLAKTYSLTEEGTSTEETEELLAIPAKMEQKPTFESGGAGLASTVDDYARFGAMLINGGTGNGHQILHPRTVDFLTKGGLTDRQQKDFTRMILDNPGYTYGNLLRVLNNRPCSGCMASTGEYGWGGALGTGFSNSPKEKITIVYMMQRMMGGKVDLFIRLYNMIMNEFGGPIE
jgi:CubicO group peptidase (beta-lactamase class C family)